jgi:hypothetical protein
MTHFGKKRRNFMAVLSIDVSDSKRGRMQVLSSQGKYAVEARAYLLNRSAMK